MQYRLEKINKIRLSLEGRLDYRSMDVFEDMLNELISLDPDMVSLDFSCLYIVDSAGIDGLFSMRTIFPDLPMFLNNPPPAVRQLLSLTQADTLFDVG